VKLLVVEDEERIASFLDKGLTAHGYSVEWASTGAEALQLGTGPDVALVILDLKLPDLDGLSEREFSLLRAFVGHPREVLSRRELLAMAWGMEFDPRTNLVDVYVGYLRRKIGEPVIETVRGAGYRLRIDGP